MTKKFVIILSFPVDAHGVFTTIWVLSESSVFIAVAAAGRRETCRCYSAFVVILSFPSLHFVLLDAHGVAFTT
jgi:hypothetical protein